MCNQSAIQLISNKRSNLMDLADPLTAAALHIEVALRLLPGEAYDVRQARAQLVKSMGQLRLAHSVFGALTQHTVTDVSFDTADKCNCQRRRST